MLLSLHSCLWIKKTWRVLHLLQFVRGGIQGNVFYSPNVDPSLLFCKDNSCFILRRIGVLGNLLSGSK